MRVVNIFYQGIYYTINLDRVNLYFYMPATPTQKASISVCMNEEIFNGQSFDGDVAVELHEYLLKLSTTRIGFPPTPSI